MQTSESIRPDREDESMQGAAALTGFGPFRSWKADARGVTVNGEKASLAVMFVAEHTVRIVGTPGADPASTPPVSAIVPGEPPFPIDVKETDEELRICGKSLTAVVRKATMFVEVLDASGKAVVAELELLQGQRKLRCRGPMNASARIYGLGETTGFLNKRGERYTMWNSDIYDPHVPDMESLYQSIPFLIHHDEDSAYGLLVDNPGKTAFDMRADSGAYLIDPETGALDLYVIAGPGLKDVVSRYTALTGRMKLPPLWALGYQQSRYSYMSQEEVMQLARTFRERNIPCDVIYLDIHYMDEYRVFTFDRQRFPEPEKMIAELKEMGFRIVPIVDPGVKKDEQYDVYREGISRELFCKKIEGTLFVGEVWPGDSAFPDFSDERTADWWGGLHRFYTDMGISGIWNDMNEPSVFACESKTMDLDVLHRNNGNPQTHREWHNMYGLSMSKATYEGLEKLLEGERPFVLTRAGYAGIQRYAAVWTGDNRSYWEHMAMFMAMGMNLGLSGVAFCGSDIGGFVHHTSGELLARWMQMGVFAPLSRNHCAMEPVYQEPWQFGPEVEEICRRYIGLRYRLLPYLYTLFYEASRTGLPIMRPLVLEYPHDEHTHNLCDQFMFGPNMIVAPIYRPSTEYRAVYLPEGIWYDYWTGERHEGGRHILAHAPLDTLPIYVKAGAIVPETALRQHTADAGWSELALHVYCGGADSSGVFRLYEDDGLTDGYGRGEYNLLNVRLEERERSLQLQYAYDNQGYDNGRESLKLIFKQLPSLPADVEGLHEIRDFGEWEHADAGWLYDRNKGELFVKLRQASAGEVTIVL